MNLREWGILPGYENAAGVWQKTPDASQRAVLRAMRAHRGRAEDRPGAPRVVFLRQGESRPIDGPVELSLEDGTSVPVHGYLPRDLPLGYHELLAKDTGERTRVIVSPGRCFLPENLSAWGWAVQLYSLRSRKSWGIGDLRDLRSLGRWSQKKLGADMLLVSPLHAPAPTLPQQPSPYYPSSRLFRNPLHLRVEDVPGADRLGPLLARLAAEGRALLESPRIDRDAAWKLKMSALEGIWKRFGGAPAFDRYCGREGKTLATYATYCALAEQHGPCWRTWPRRYRSPESADVLRWARAHRKRVRFHQWLQWLTDEQLAKAGREIGLVGDLAVGIDPSGADAWMWQDLFATGMEVGAPPDEFNTQGQKWGLLPFDPWRLRSAGYEPFLRIVRSGLCHTRGLRLDHVMGLFRLFWIPVGQKPAEGAYVRYPALDLLDIVALESERAGAYVVGEDLGTVEDSVRSELAYRRILSYRVMWFENRPTTAYPKNALATVTTHDLPTIAGVWSGADLTVQRELGLAPNEEGTAAMRRMLVKLAGQKAPIGKVISKTHEALARAPSSLVAATLEDAIGALPRPNMPGTTDQYPSWCIPLPKTLEEIEKDPLVARVARSLSRGRGQKRRKAASARPKQRDRKAP